MTTIRELQYFEALARHLHFGKAANECHVSQPTLSGQIQKMEEQLGLQLLERTKRSVMLTKEGETLLVEAKKVLHAHSNLQACAQTLQDPLSGSFHIGMIPTLSSYLLPHITQPLKHVLENAHMFWHEDKTSTLIKQLRNGELDILILPMVPELEDFNYYSICDEPLLVAASSNHPILDREILELQHLQGETILSLEDGHCLRNHAMSFCFAAGANELNNYKATSLETLRYMLTGSEYITLLPALACYNRNDAGVTYRSFDGTQPSRELVLAVRNDYPKLAIARAFVSTIRDTLNFLASPQ